MGPIQNKRRDVASTPPRRDVASTPPRPPLLPSRPATATVLRFAPEWRNGRRGGFKIRSPSRGVWVQVPPLAPRSNGPLTQRLECHPHTVEVGGSNPPWPTSHPALAKVASDAKADPEPPRR